MRLILLRTLYISLLFGFTVSDRACAEIPKANPPAKTLTVLDAANLAADERLFAVSVQGIVNRKQPRIWIKGVQGDDHWLNVLKARGLVNGTRECGSIADLARIYRSEISGLVVTDPHLILTVNMATMISALRGFAIVTPELADNVPIPIKADLRGRWKNEEDAYRWAYENLWPSMNRSALAWACPGERFHCERDYFIQNKIWLLWVNRREDEGKLGCSRMVEMRWTEKIFKETRPNIPIFGYPANGHGFEGIGEMSGTAMASAYAKYNVCTNLNTNLSVHSGYPSARLKQKRQDMPKYDPSKSYIAFIISDGDNLLTWNDYYLRLWQQKPVNRPPIAWSIGPAAAHVMPEVVKWYYEKALPGDTFMADHSGAGYIYPAVWGDAFRDRKIEADYVGLTADMCRMLDIRTVALHEYLGISLHHLELYQKNWPELVAVFPDYTRQRRISQDRRSYKLPGGLPVMHSVISFSDSPDCEQRISKAVEDICKAAEEKTAFINGFIINWFNGPDDCAEIIKRLGDGFVAVTPETLGVFARKNLETAVPETNAALSAWAYTRRTNIIDTHAGSRFENAKYACDGSNSTYWDEDDNAPEYRLILDFPEKQRIRRIELMGYEQEHYAPRSFDIICDGSKIKTVNDLRYKKNLAEVNLPEVQCSRLELRIFKYYGGSPSIRELRVFEN